MMALVDQPSREDGTTNSSSPRLPKQEPAAWRQHGERRRRQLIQNDQEMGGTCFRISSATNIVKYFALAERVMLQFQKLSQHLEHSAEDAYVIGHRVITFLEEALPSHPQFHNSYYLQKAQQDARQIRQQLQIIVNYIDEQELNHWVEQEFDPQIEDEDDEDNEQQQQPPQEDPNTGWESFQGWSSNRSIPDILETDESSVSIEEDLPRRTVRDLILPQQEQDDSGSSSSSSSEEEIEHTTALRYRPAERFDCNDEACHTDDTDTYGQWSSGKDFLKQIKAQKIEYETDSDAADSWAQEDPPELPPPVPHNSPRTHDSIDYHPAGHWRYGIFGSGITANIR